MIGKTLAHYEIIEKLGSGGMGDVYRARDTKLDRDVALKVLPKDMADDTARRARFEREARTIASFKHPNIVTVYSVEESGGVLFLTMELVEGKSLEELIPSDGMRLSKFFDIAVPLADAIAGAHAQGIAHRDLKPANVMLDSEGRVKVLDFGLAKLWQTDLESGDTIASDGDTQPGTVMGTVSYMSPEQAEGKEVDHRTDIFSLGIIFYEMATGERPFKGDSSLSIMSSILRDTPRSVSEMKRTLPTQLSRIIQYCLAKEADRRFQNALDIRNELENLRTEVDSSTSTQTAVNIPIPSSTGRRRIGIGAAIVFGLLGVIFGPGLLKKDGGGVPTAEANSLAIFPFDNLKDPNDPERVGQILQELLITDLSGVQALKVYSSQRLDDVEDQLKNPRGDKKAIAGTVAARAGARSMLTGTLSKLGANWIITCQLVDVEKGTIIKSKRIDGSDLYAMVDQLTQELHADFRIGEPAEDVALRIPIKQKTSESLEAYREYLDGVEKLNDWKLAEALASLEKAIEIDPDFGQAHYALGVTLWWEGGVTSQLGAERLKYLLDNELYASDREKAMAETMLEVVQSRWADALPLAEELTRKYPDEKEAWYALGEAQFHFPGGSKLPDSYASFRRAVALDPDFRLAYAHIFDILASQKRYDDGITLANEQLTRDPDTPYWYQKRAVMVVAKRDKDASRDAIGIAEAKCKTPADKRRLYSDLGAAYGGIADIGRATMYMEKAVEADPDTRDAILIRQLVTLLSQTGNWEAVEERVELELARTPEDQWLLGEKLNVYQHKHMYSEARSFARDLKKKYPENPQWYQELAMMEVYSGTDETARKAIADAGKQFTAKDDTRRLLSNVANAYTGTGNYNSASRYFLDAIATDPDNEYPNLYENIASQYLMCGRPAVAREWFEKALAGDPKHVGALFGMAVMTTIEGDEVTGNVYFERALNALPVTWFSPYAWTFFHILTGDFEKAEAKLVEAEAVEMSDQVRWDFLVNRPGELGIGWAFLLAGERERAKEIFIRASEDPMSQKDPRAYEGLGWSHLALGDLDKAKAAFTTSLNIGYSHRYALHGLASTELLRGNVDEARKYALQAEEGENHHVTTKRVLGYINFADGNFEKARTYGETSVAMDSSRTSNELLAWTLIAGDLDIPAGIAAARRAEQIAEMRGFHFDSGLPFMASYEHSLGVAYMKQGDPKTAVEHLERAVEMHPERHAAQDDLKRAQELAQRSP